MKKAALAIFLMLVVQLISARWSSKAVTATHSEDVIQTPADTSLANGLSIKGMTDRSDLVAIGSCVDTSSVWLNRTLVTLATISVVETLKGAEQRAITVALPGGIDANRKFPVAMSYAGRLASCLVKTCFYSSGLTVRVLVVIR